MLSLTRKCDYALVALAYLGDRHVAGESAVSARRIADQFKLPLPLLMNILKELMHVGIVDSTRGPHGGYTLARAPEQISLLEVVTAMDGPTRVTMCTNPLPIVGQGCEITETCPVREPMRRLNERVNDFFAKVTLADLFDSKVDVPVGQVGRPVAVTAARR